MAAIDQGIAEEMLADIAKGINDRIDALIEYKHRPKEYIN